MIFWSFVLAEALFACSCTTGSSRTSEVIGFESLQVYQFTQATLPTTATRAQDVKSKVPEGLKAYTYKEIHVATDGFKEQLGMGAFGTVYKGLLPDGKPIAVKNLDKLMEEGENEFRTEMSIIGTTHHKHLVQLYGFCDEGSERLLVYEYMCKGSLDTALFKGDSFLSWNLRVQIAIGIARGILYLHEECRTQNIHCNIKPQNILLDDNYITLRSQILAWQS
eukprot:Gb_39887 [translate_table: standard]